MKNTQDFVRKKNNEILNLENHHHIKILGTKICKKNIKIINLNQIFLHPKFIQLIKIINKNKIVSNVFLKTASYLLEL